jgi:hypothetical protein
MTTGRSLPAQLTGRVIHPDSPGYTEAAVTVLMTVEVASLAVLDHPFSPIARIQPSAMTDAIALLEARSDPGRDPWLMTGAGQIRGASGH